MMLYKKVKVRSPDGDTNFFDMVADVPWEDTLAPYLSKISLNYVPLISIDLMKENSLTLEKARSRRYSPLTTTDTDYVDDIALLANSPTLAEYLLLSLDRITT